MQHKLYSKLVARLDDGTISVDTVKHPVSFGQVAVLNAMGHIYTVLNGATAADAQALNKADKFPVGNGEREKARNRVLSELAREDVLTEAYGGDIQVVEVSARTGEGVDALMDAIKLQADVMEVSVCMSLFVCSFS